MDRFKEKKITNSGESCKSRDGKIKYRKTLCEPCKNTRKLQFYEEMTKMTTQEMKYLTDSGPSVIIHSKQYDFIVNHVIRINKKELLLKVKHEDHTHTLSFAI